MSTTQSRTSQKQIEANRLNSNKSTGPKTEVGKQNSACNNLKHGLYSTQIVIKSASFSEDPVEYEQLLEALHEELKPNGKLQEHLVIKIANCIWRSHRVIRAETAHINAQMDRSYLDIEAAEKRKLWKVRDGLETDSELTAAELERVVDNSIGKRSIPTDSTARYILRCEMRLDRQLSRAYALLRSLQAKAEADFKKIKAVYKEQETVGGKGDVDFPKNEHSKPFMPDVSVGASFIDDDPTLEPLKVAVRKSRQRARANSSRG